MPDERRHLGYLCLCGLLCDAVCTMKMTLSLRCWLKALLGGLALLIGGCADIPEGVEPVEGFEIGRYLGRWYEIARLDHPFERGLSNITATYSRAEDGSLRVLNRGYDEKRQTWREAEGRAAFVKSPDVGRLKVSFFGPFYGGYNIIALDKQDYRYAMVAGNDRDYLWILSRTPQMDPAVQARLLEQAENLGFAVQALIYVRHDRS